MLNFYVQFSILKLPEPCFEQTISQFLNDPESMMANRGAWQDGQAAVSWLTGNHVGTSWVAKFGLNFLNDIKKTAFIVNHV